MLNWPLTLVRCFSLTSRVHRKPKCDTHGHLCLIFGNIPILTNLSTLITKIRKRGVLFPLTILSLLQTKTLLKRYKYIVKFIIGDGPLENLWEGRSKYKKNIRAREN